MNHSAVIVNGTIPGDARYIRMKEGIYCST